MGFSVPCEKLILYLTVQALTRHRVISCNSFHLMIAIGRQAPKEIYFCVHEIRRFIYLTLYVKIALNIGTHDGS